MIKVEIIKDNILHDILNMKLIDMRCKHVSNIITCDNRAKKVLNESLNIGYQWCQWGVHSNNIHLEYHLEKIRKMERENYNHAIRVVILKYNFSNKLHVWTDNLHSTILYIRKYGLDVRLKDIPFYIISLTTDNVQIFDYNNSLRNKNEDIFGAISCAYERLNWSNSKLLIDMNYIVGDFTKWENNINEKIELISREEILHKQG